MKTNHQLSDFQIFLRVARELCLICEKQMSFQFRRFFVSFLYPWIPMLKQGASIHPSYISLFLLIQSQPVSNPDSFSAPMKGKNVKKNKKWKSRMVPAAEMWRGDCVWLGRGSWRRGKGRKGFWKRAAQRDGWQGQAATINQQKFTQSLKREENNLIWKCRNCKRGQAVGNGDYLLK